MRPLTIVLMLCAFPFWAVNSSGQEFVTSLVMIARPRLGNPLILTPQELKRFEITVAGRLRWLGDRPEPEIPIPTPEQVAERLRRYPPRITVKGKEITLNVLNVGEIFRHPKFQSDYGSGKFAETGAEQQYEVYYRWEARVSVGLGEGQINDLETSVGWPTFLELRIMADPDTTTRWTVSNPHAIYVHETLRTSSEFTILHITDTHIARRNDQIPEILCQVRKQDTSSVTKEHHYWVNAGLGWGSFGVSGGIGLSYQIRNSIISLRYVYNEEFDFFGGDYPRESVSDLGVLYGINTKGPYGLASLSGGISFVRVVRRGRFLYTTGGWWFGSSTYEKLTFHTLGIPIEAQLFWTPLSFFGIGIYAAGNLNSQRSFAAVLLCLQLGKLR